MGRPARSKRHRGRKGRLPFGEGGPCSLLGECQACPLLPLSYEEQCFQKFKHFRSYLDEYPALRNISVSTSSVPPLQAGYRHTVKPAVRRSEEADHEMLIGLYKPGSHELLDLGNCYVQSPEINQLLELLRHEASQYHVMGYREGDEETSVSDCSIIRYVVVRQGEHQGRTGLYLTLVCTSWHSEQLLSLISTLAQTCSSLSGAAVHLNQMEGNAIFDRSQPTQHLWGEAQLSYSFTLNPDVDKAPLQFIYSAASFAQVNPFVAEHAYQEVITGLDPQPGQRAIDLYCGVGVIGLGLASVARSRGGELQEIWGLEESRSSIQDAEHNAEMLGINEAQFLLGRAEDRLSELVQRWETSPKASSTATESELIVALNPSRRGCQPQVIDLLARLKPAKIAYMSCHPRTLTRDLNLLCHQGYELIKVSLFDMFPGSQHYETVSLLKAV